MSGGGHITAYMLCSLLLRKGLLQEADPWCIRLPFYYHFNIILFFFAVVRGEALSCVDEALEAFIKSGLEGNISYNKG